MEAAENGHDAESKRRRAKHSKTRSGCSRCKQRHVKCDEEKPSCQRCIQAGLPCPGYEEVTTRQSRGLVKRLRIVPERQKHVLAPAISRDASRLPTPTASLPMHSRSNSFDVEQSAIDFFTSRTMTTLAKYVPGTQLWTLQTFTCLLADAKIRNIVIAIGLAHQDMLTHISEGRGPYTSAVQAERCGTAYSQEALAADRYYNASLAYMRIDISTIKEQCSSERTDVAAACLLIVIYLSLQDRVEEAAVHMSCGIEVVNEGGQAFLEYSHTNQEIYLLFLHYATASWAMHPSAALFDIMQSTVELSCHITCLDTLSALRFDIDLHAQKVFLFAHKATRGLFGDTKTMLSNRQTLSEHSDQVFEKLDKYASTVKSAVMLGTATGIEEVFVDTMRARLNSYRIFSQSVATRYQTTYDRYTQLFDDSISLIGQAMQRGSAHFGIDWQVISLHLNVIGTLRQLNLLCRHPTIRRRGLNILRYVPQREGVHEAGEGLQLGRMTIEFEEADVNLDPQAKFTTPVPEENRLHYIGRIRRDGLQGVTLADGEILVRMMYRPNGDATYVERRIKIKKEHFHMEYQRTIEA